MNGVYLASAVTYALTFGIASAAHSQPQANAGENAKSIVIVAPFSSAGSLGADASVGHAIVEGLAERLILESDRVLLPWDSLIVTMPPSIQAQLRPTHLMGCGPAIRQMAFVASSRAIVVCGDLEELPDGTHRMSGTVANRFGSERLEHVLPSTDEGVSYLLEMIKAADR